MVRPIDGNNLNPSDWNRTSDTQPQRIPTTTARQAPQGGANTSVPLS